MQDESARLRQLPRASDAASRPDARAAPRATSRSSAPRSAGGAGSVSSVSSAWVEGLSKETTRKRQTMLVDACGRWTCATARSATTKTARASRARQSDVMTATLLSEPDDGKHRLPAVRRPLIRERSSMPFSLAPVTVLRRQPEAADRVALGVKLDEDCRLGPCDPRVVSGLDRDDLRRHDLECTAVPVPPLHATAGEEADVRVHAVLRADNGSDVRGPAEAWRVDDPLHPAVGGAHDVELDARDHAVLCASDGRRQRIPRPTPRPPARGRCRTRPGRSSRALHPRLPGRTSADRRHAPAQNPGERARLVKSERGGRRDAAHATPGALLEAIASHVDVNAKTRWEHELRAGRHGGEREREREQTAAGNDRPRHHVTPKLSPRRNAVKGSRRRLSSYSARDDTASRRTRSVNRSS